MPESPRVAPPRQPRTRRTLERIVAAGLALLEEEGPSGVTVQAVVSRARSSVGSFYARFRGKEDLLAYLRARIRDAAFEGWREGLPRRERAAASLAEAASAAVAALLDVRGRWDGSLKAAAELAEGSADHDAFRRAVVEELALRLLERRSEITHASPEVAARVGLWAVLGVIDHEGSAATPTGLDQGAVRSECTALLVAYLSGRSEPSAQVDFFDVWS